MCSDITALIRQLRKLAICRENVPQLPRQGKQPSGVPLAVRGLVGLLTVRVQNWPFHGTEQGDVAGAPSVCLNSKGKERGLWTVLDHRVRAGRVLETMLCNFY